MRLARMRSRTAGAPPRCKCPSTSKPGVERHPSLFQLLPDPVHAAGDDSFGHDDDPRGLAAPLLLPEAFDDLIDLERDLGNQCRIGPGRQRGVNGDLPAVPAHHLDQEQAFGCISGVADFVDGFRRGADGAREADADVSAGKIIVDRARTADHEAVPVVA